MVRDDFFFSPFLRRLTLGLNQLLIHNRVGISNLETRTLNCLLAEF